MKSSCIAHPERDSLIIIRQWQLQFCEGNHVAAALMSYLEYWHDIKLGMRGQNRTANNTAERQGDERSQDESLWQHHKAEEIEAGLMGIAKRDKIREAEELLIRKGVIEVGNNPNPRYNFDRTKFFLFHPEVVNAWLRVSYRSVEEESPICDKSQIDLRFIANASAINPRPSAENRKPSAENRRAITEITSEITSETTSEINHHPSTNARALANVARAEAEMVDGWNGAGEVFIQSLDEDGLTCLISWLWLLNGFCQENTVDQLDFASRYKDNPFKGKNNPVGYIVSMVRNRDFPRLHITHREQILEDLSAGGAAPTPLLLAAKVTGERRYSL